MSQIRHEWLTKYFDDRPQIGRPGENSLGFDIPYQWKCVVEKLLSDREALNEIARQHIGSEIKLPELADFEDAYLMCVQTARAATQFVPDTDT